MKMGRLLTLIVLAAALVGPAPGLAQALKPAAKPAPPLAAPAETPATTPSGTSVEDYVLGPEDIIDVQVQGADYHFHGRIAQDNMVPLPYLKDTVVGGMTRRQLQDKLEDALKKGGYFVKPIVQVEIAGYASRNVTVLGSVGAPGVVAVDRPYRLSEIIARVGGVRDDGADYVVLTADGSTRNLPVKGLSTGGADQDPIVRPGDKIYVPKADLFYLSGEIRSPGAYAITSGLTLRQALAKGGGVTDAGNEKRVKVTRSGKEVRISLDDKIENGDIILVPQRLF